MRRARKAASWQQPRLAVVPRGGRGRRDCLRFLSGPPCGGAALLFRRHLLSNAAFKLPPEIHYSRLVVMETDLGMLPPASSLIGTQDSHSFQHGAQEVQRSKQVGLNAAPAFPVASARPGPENSSSNRLFTFAELTASLKHIHL